MKVSRAELLSLVFFIFNLIMYLPVLSVVTVSEFFKTMDYDNRKMTGYNRQSQSSTKVVGCFYRTCIIVGKQDLYG